MHAAKRDGNAPEMTRSSVSTVILSHSRTKSRFRDSIEVCQVPETLQTEKSIGLRSGQSGGHSLALIISGNDLA